MDDNELVVVIGTLGVRINFVRNTVSGPTSVRNAAVSLVNPVEIQQSFHC